ncbi:UNVERIFIED_ORG: hypothetical protein E4P37_01075 [Bacillus sp. AZ43]
MAENSRIRTIEQATGRTWEDWCRFLDGVGARDLDHAQIAPKVHAELEGSVESAGWWAQSVTVAYEQFIGRRLPGQRADGRFETSVSRSTPFDMRELMDRWEQFAAGDESVRDLVVGDARVSGSERRLTWRARAADGSSLVVTSEPKKNGTASLVVTHAGLPSPEAMAAARDTWAAVAGRFLGRD